MIFRRSDAHRTATDGVDTSVYATGGRPDGLAIAYQETSTGQAGEVHHPQSASVYYVIEGSGTWVIDGEPFAVAATDVVVVEPGKRFSFSGDLKQICVTVPPLGPEQHQPSGPADLDAPAPARRAGHFESVPVARVVGGRSEAVDDDWGDVEADIVLDERFAADVIAGLDAFSHLDIVFVFDGVDEAKINLGARHPRNNPDWPLVGIFAQRAKARPNRIGVTTCELLGVEGRTIRVRGLDAIDGTPVVDIKPHVREFGARTPVVQPEWMTELMAKYW